MDKGTTNLCTRQDGEYYSLHQVLRRQRTLWASIKNTGGDMGRYVKDVFLGSSGDSVFKFYFRPETIFP